ncbi:MAG: di-heme oxidoredictase family protein [Verrucomicrobiota bacterium]
MTFAPPNIASLAWAIATALTPAQADPQFEKPTPGEELSGGETTVFQDGQNAFALPLANITRENRRAHVVGNSFFNKNWVLAPASTEARDGLGPLFHARSCSSCHTHDGRGRPPEPDELMTSLLFRLSIPGENPHGGPKPDPTYGNQLAVRAVPGAHPEGDVEISYEEIEGTFTDDTPYSLRKPTFNLKPSGAYAAPKENLLLGPRIAPPVHGLGLLEAVPEETILAFADSDNSKTDDGISGRPNWVWNKDTQQKELGRFGWKANQPTLRQQTADAFLGDIGITSPVNPHEAFTTAQADKLADLPTGGSPEIDDHLLDRVVTYQQTLAPPARRNWTDPAVLRGKEIFHDAGCAQCHIPEMKTGDFHPVAELNNQTIRPYTDLLLHDMGEDLADHRPDFEAAGTEWRTPPLWGIGLTETVSGHTFFLHDGRARNLTEAILWHGGEAEPAREHFRSLPKNDRDDLIAFLNSL